MKIVLLVFSFITLHSFGYGTILNDSIPSGKNFEIAKFRMWYPDDLKQVKGILVLVPGSNRDGRNEALDSTWQSLAAKHDFAIIACFFKDHPQPERFIESYAKASEGSGQALVDVIKKFAITSGFPELNYAPLVMWGHSAGGQFNYEFVSWNPKRVIAFVVNKGGIYYTALVHPDARDVTGVLFTGEKDMEARNDIIKGLFSINRRVGALWIYAPEPDAGHEIGATKAFSIDYFNQIIPLRLSGTGELNNLSEAEGLLGDHKTLSIYPYSDLENFKYPVSWFPSKAIADIWLDFVLKK